MVGFPLGFHDTLHHLPVVRQAVIASSFGLPAALPAADLDRWRMHLEWTAMPLGQVLYESGSVPSHVVFLATAIVALLHVMENGASAEIAMIGNEGLVGTSVFMGGGATPGRAVVQSAGHGFRMKAHQLDPLE